MNKTEIAVAVLLVVMVAAVMYVQRPPEEPDTLPTAEAPEVAPAAPASDEPQIRYPVEAPAPVPETSSAETPDASQEQPAGMAESTEAPVPAAAPTTAPLPVLDESDTTLKEELSPVFDWSTYARLFYVDRLIRRFVVTVDNLPNRQYPRSNYRIQRPVAGQLVVRRVRIYDGGDETLYLNPDNYARYDRFVAFVNGLNSQRLVMLYRHFYPLFQAAYEDLGYPSAYFNDRLVEVIDHLLATPEVTGDIKLVRPHVLFRYADPQLEALSAGQKVLLRVGPAHAAVLRQKLVELRTLLTGEPGEAAAVSEQVPSQPAE